MHSRPLFLVMLLLLFWSFSPAQSPKPLIDLPPRQPARLRPDSPFGINTAFEPDTKDLEPRIKAMEAAGITWGRQDFTWRAIEKSPGQYDFSGYDRLVDLCRRHGVLLIGDLAYAPAFHDPRTDQGIAAYARLTQAAAEHFRGRVDHWQIWNEPNGGYWKGSPGQYARLLAAAGQAIHKANPDAKVLGLNMAFCDVLWAGEILKQVPYDCFDIACFHPYRPPSAPEDGFDWWENDQYVKSWHQKDLTPEYPMVHMSYLEQAEQLRKTMRPFGRAKPLWVTEICWNTNIHPYGSSELRSADMLVRFYVQSIASGKVDKVFWWTLKDGGNRQFDMADMVGLMRSDLTPKYAYYAYAWMTHLLEGKKPLRNDVFGPDVFCCTFGGADSNEETIVAWANKPTAYIRVNNTEKGLVFHDIFGVERRVPFDAVRTRSLPVPLGQSPIYITGPKGIGARLRPEPGW